MSKARLCIRLHNVAQVDIMTPMCVLHHDTSVCVAEVWLMGGKSWECVIQAEEG